MGRRETIEYGGATFHRYPDSPDLATRRHFKPCYRDRKRGVQNLHREVWKAAHGEPPPDHEIALVDRDGANVDLENLRCVPFGRPGIHCQGPLARRYAEETCNHCGATYTPKSSPGGVLRFCSGRCETTYHREQGTYDEDRICEVCEGPFRKQRYSKVRTCSKPCASALKSRERLRGEAERRAALVVA